MLKTKLLSVALAGCFMILGSQVKAADDNAITTLKKGSHSLQFAFPAGFNGQVGGAAGWWYLVTDNINIGLNLGVSTQPGAGGDDFQFDIAPAVRYFIMKKGNVAPFAFGQVRITIADSGVVGADTDAIIGLQGGVGAEYFVMKQLSLSGQVGLNLDLNRPAGVDSVLFNTFTSNLSLNIYFN